jgi:hypothetical protein
MRNLITAIVEVAVGANRTLLAVHQAGPERGAAVTAPEASLADVGGCVQIITIGRCG